jgi:hypothetical protein
MLWVHRNRPPAPAQPQRVVIQSSPVSLAERDWGRVVTISAYPQHEEPDVPNPSPPGTLQHRASKRQTAGHPEERPEVASSRHTVLCCGTVRGKRSNCLSRDTSASALRSLPSKTGTSSSLLTRQ